MSGVNICSVGLIIIYMGLILRKRIWAATHLHIRNAPSKLFHFLWIVKTSIVLSDRHAWGSRATAQLGIILSLWRILKLALRKHSTMWNSLILVRQLSQQWLVLIILRSSWTHIRLRSIIYLRLLLLLNFLVTYKNLESKCLSNW